MTAGRYDDLLSRAVEMAGLARADAMRAGSWGDGFDACADLVDELTAALRESEEENARHRAVVDHLTERAQADVAHERVEIARLRGIAEALGVQVETLRTRAERADEIISRLIHAVETGETWRSVRSADLALSAMVAGRAFLAETTPQIPEGGPAMEPWDRPTSSEVEE